MYNMETHSHGVGSAEDDIDHPSPKIDTHPTSHTHSLVLGDRGDSFVICTADEQCQAKYSFSP